MAMTPTSEPTDRSMLRDTMTRTMPVAMIATTAVWTDSVTMLVGWMQRPAAVTMPKPIRIDDQGDEHAEQPEIDLRLREQRRGSRSARVGSAWSDLEPVLPATFVIGGPPGQGAEATCAPGDRERRSHASTVDG